MLSQVHRAHFADTLIYIRRAGMSIAANVYTHTGHTSRSSLPHQMHSANCLLRALVQSSMKCKRAVTICIQLAGS